MQPRRVWDRATYLPQPLSPISDDATANIQNQTNRETAGAQSTHPQAFEQPAQHPFGINIVKHINIVGLPNTSVRLNTWTSVVADSTQPSVEVTIPGSPSGFERYVPVEFVDRSVTAVYPPQYTNERVNTPIESVEFFPKPINQERRARQKQLLSQPVYQSLPNWYEKVHSLAGDQSTTQAQTTNVREVQASQAPKQSVEEVYLGEHMLNRDRDVISSQNHGPLPTEILQMLLAGSADEVPLNPSILNQYLVNYLKNLGKDSRPDPNPIFPTPQIPQYGQYAPEEGSDGAAGPVKSSLMDPCLSPSVVQHHSIEETQYLQELSSLLITTNIEQSWLGESRSGVDSNIKVDSSTRTVSRTPASPQVAALKTSSTVCIVPDTHGSLLTAARPLDHVSDHVRAQDRSQPTGVSQTTIQPNRNDPGYNGPWQNPAPNIPTLPKTDAADIQMIPLEQHYFGTQAEPQLIDPSQLAATPFDLDKNRMRASMCTNQMEPPVPLGQRTIAEPPIQMSPATPGIPIPYQRNQVVNSSQDSVQTGRDVREGKIPTQVENITRIHPVTYTSISADRVVSVTQEWVVEGGTRYEETINHQANLGHQSIEMLPKVGEIQGLTHPIVTVKLPAQSPFGVSETIEVRSPEDLKHLYEVLSQAARYAENSPSAAHSKMEARHVKQETYYSAVDVQTDVNQQGQSLPVDQPILPKQFQVSEKDGMLLALDNPRSTDALLTTSERFDTNPVRNTPVPQSQDLLGGKLDGDLFTKPTTSSVMISLHCDDGRSEIEPVPIPRSQQLPTAPTLNPDASLDQVESYADSEYASDRSNQHPPSLRTSSYSTHQLNSRAVAHPVSVEQDRTEPLNSIGQMRVKPARTSDKVSSRATVSGCVFEGRIQGPSTQFHSGRINFIPVSTDAYHSRTTSLPPSYSSQPSVPPRAPSTAPPATNTTDPNVMMPIPMMMEQMMRTAGLGSTPSVGDRTSQIRITKESVNRHVEWNWKREFTGDDRNQATPGQEIGWASMNDSYEVRREVRLYTEGFVPPFALGEHPQILINLNAQPGLQYDLDFGDSRNLHVGVRAGSAPASNTNTNKIPSSVGLVTSDLESGRSESQLEEDPPKVRKKMCMPIRQLFPKKTASALR